jgi:hypothetical protein
MMNPTTIPVTIAPEAAARVAELGMQRELERMLDFLRQEVSGVLSVDVQLAMPYDTGDETSIVLEVPLDRPLSDASGRRQLRDWMAEALPPVVNRYFTILTVPAPLPAGDSLLPEEAMSATGVPVTVTPEADQRVAELGMQRELRRMLEHALQTIPNLRAVEVTLAPAYDAGEEPGIKIAAIVEQVGALAYESEKREVNWMWETFPANVCLYFHLTIHAAARPTDHAR